MTTVLQKYLYVFQTGLQQALVYRTNFLLRGMFSFVHLAVVVTLWTAAFSDSPTIGGFTLQQTLTYFITIIVVNFLIGAMSEDYQISEEIRNGTINQYLLKPVNYYAYRFSIFLAARAISGSLILVPLLVSLPFLQSYFDFPQMDFWRLGGFFVAAGLAAILQFTVAYCFGLLAFWFLEIQGLVMLSYALEVTLSGQIFPLDLMPPMLQAVSQLLPFSYMAYFPVAILTGRIDLATVPMGIAIQFVWIVVLLFLAGYMWRKGLRKHTAVGG